MAANEATIMQLYVTASQQGLVDKNNLLGGTFGAHKLLLDMAKAGVGPIPNDTPQISALGFKSLPKIAVLNNDGITVRSERSPIGTFGAAGTTAFHNVTRSTVEVEVNLTTPVTGFDNAVSAETELFKRIRQAINKMQRAIEALSLTAIDGAKAQVNPLQFPFAFNATADAVLVQNVAGQTLEAQYNNVQTAIEAANSYAVASDFHDGKYLAMLFGSSAATAVRNAGRFGQQNFQNLNGMLNGMSAYESSVLAPGSGDLGIFYALGAGSAGLYTWTSPDARAKRKGTNGEMYTAFIPELGFEVDVTEVNFFGDTSALANGDKRTYQRSMKMAVDLFHIVEYSEAPTTKATGILRFNWKPAA